MFLIAKSGTRYAVYNARRKKLARVKSLDTARSFVRNQAVNRKKPILFVNDGKTVKAFLEGEPVTVKNLDVHNLQQAVRMELDENSGEVFAYIKELYVENLEPVSGYIVYEVEGEETDKAVNFSFDGQKAAFDGEPIDVEAVYVQVEAGEAIEDARQENPDQNRGGVLTNENEDNERDYSKSAARFVKAEQPGEVVVGGYLTVFGNAEERDLEAEYFTKNTDFWLDYYDGQPVFFHHAAGETPDGFPEDTPRKFLVGHVKNLHADDIGLWVDAVVTERSKWVDAVVKLIEEGVLNWSSGSVAHLVRRAKDGHLWSWPIAEASLTHTPAEFRMTDAAIIREEFRSVGASSALKALESSDEQAQVRLNAIDTYFATKQTEDTNMLTEALLKAIKSMFDIRWPELKEDAARLQETKSAGSLNDLLEPMAFGISDVLGADRDAVLKAVVEMAETALDGNDGAGGANSADTMPSVEEIATKAAQAVLDALPDSQGASATKNVNINFNDPSKAPDTLARAIRAVRDKDRAYLAAKGARNYQAHVKAGNIKTLGIDPDSAGGFLVSPEHSDDVIELLRTNSVFMSKRTDNAGGEVRSLATVMPMATDTMSIPKQTGGASGAWLGENAQLTGTDPTFGQILLVAKKYGTLIKVSNELLDDASPDVDALIRDDMAADMADAVDAAVFSGTGVGNQPLGLDNMGAAVTKTAINGVPTYAQLLGPRERLELANVRRDNTWAWVWNPRELTWLRQKEDTAGSLIWAAGSGYGQVIAGSEPEEFLGFPYYNTTNITIDAADNNETVIYFARWRDLIIAQRKTIEIRASDVAGTSFEYDQTWIRAIMRMDIAVRHEESFELLTDVRAS